MYYISLEINGQDIELSQQENIAITYSINDIKELGSREGAGSKQFKIPATRRNRKALAWVEELSTPISPALFRAPAILRVNENIVLEGVAEIESFEHSGEIGFYNVSLYGDNAGWWRSIEGKKLTDLHLPELQHNYTNSAIVNSWHHTWKNGYTYPLIDYGLIRSHSFALDHTFAFRDWLPAVFVKYLVNKIVKEAGYKLAGSFFKELVSSQLIIPFSRGKLEHTQEWVKGWNATLKRTGALTKTSGPGTYDLIDWDSISKNENGLVVESQGFQVLEAATEAIAVDIYIDAHVSGSNPVKFDLVRKYTNGSFAHMNLLAEPDPNSGNTRIQHTWENIEILAGEQIHIKFDDYGGTSSGTINSAYAEVSARPVYLEGTAFEVQSLLPELKQTELIQALFSMFNLYIFTDERTKTVYIERAEHFHTDPEPGNTASYADWSGKLDISKTITKEYNINPYGQLNTFKFTEGGDDDISAYNEKNGEPYYGDGVLAIQDGRLEESTEAAATEFSPTWMDYSFLHTFHLPFIDLLELDGNEFRFKGNDPGLRILVYAGKYDINLLNPYMTQLNFNGGEPQVPYAYFWKKEYAGMDALNLDYDQNLYFQKPNIQEPYGKSVVDTCFKDTIERMKKAVMVKCWLHLDAFDISRLDFRKPVYLQEFNQFFYINAITDYIPGSPEPVEAELLFFRD